MLCWDNDTKNDVFFNIFGFPVPVDPGGSWGYLWGLPWASLGVAWGSPAGRLEFFPNSCSQLRVLVGFKESGVVPKSVSVRCRQESGSSVLI